MLIKVRVFSRARGNDIKEDAGIFKIHTTSPAADNKANRAVIGMLADFFKVKKSAVSIKRGERAREKTVEIVS